MSVSPTTAFEDRVRQREMPRNPLETIPVGREPSGKLPNTPLTASTISFLLGSLFTSGAIIFCAGGLERYWWATYQLGFFISAWSFFHWAEYAVTAGWNLEKCSIDSFLLENGSLYHIVNGLVVLEYLITLNFKPDFKSSSTFTTIGICLSVFGQILRSTAMIHASTNFSHAVAFRKRQNHQLVTGGIYRYFRHPSYAGFFYWALGTQLALQNIGTFVITVIILWRFFYYRIRAEEAALVRFFGDDYVNYRKKVGTKILFIP